MKYQKAKCWIKRHNYFWHNVKNIRSFILKNYIWNDVDENMLTFCLLTFQPWLFGIFQLLHRVDVKFNKCNKSNFTLHILPILPFCHLGYYFYHFFLTIQLFQIWSDCLFATTFLCLTYLPKNISTTLS